MKITEASETTTVTTTRRKIHKTDTCVELVELWTNGHYRGVTAQCLSDEGLRLIPVFMRPETTFSVAAMKEYKGFGEFMQEHSRRELTSVEALDKGWSVYLAFHSDHVLYNADRRPVSLPYIFNYIGGPKQRKPSDIHYPRLIGLLKRHPYVLELRESIIPAYNERFCGQRGVEYAKVLLPQGLYEQLHAAAQRGGGDYPTVRAMETVQMGSYVHLIDVYGPEIAAVLGEWDKLSEWDDDAEEDED